MVVIVVLLIGMMMMRGNYDSMDVDSVWLTPCTAPPPIAPAWPSMDHRSHRLDVIGLYHAGGE